ncbi:hypothetical protein [Ahniella affigens]|uniref:hypothetical protein n=1 Tax=Ahniella affigens TaxID=2021234 RepID=UPI0011B267F4|nr:hypothetical protein [Ahniella affigens]
MTTEDSDALGESQLVIARAANQGCLITLTFLDSIMLLCRLEIVETSAGVLVSASIGVPSSIHRLSILRRNRVNRRQYQCCLTFQSKLMAAYAQEHAQYPSHVVVGDANIDLWAASALAEGSHVAAFEFLIANLGEFEPLFISVPMARKSCRRDSIQQHGGNQLNLMWAEIDHDCGIPGNALLAILPILRLRCLDQNRSQVARTFLLVGLKVSFRKGDRGLCPVCDDLAPVRLVLRVDWRGCRPSR